LKKILKPLIRECLTELFAEMNIERIVEGVISRQPTRKAAPSIQEERELLPGPAMRSAKPSLSSEDKRKMLIEKMGVVDDVWKDIYADTAANGNPVLEDEGTGKPEYVTEDQLAKLGLMKDYSKHIGMDESTQKNEGEWKNLRDRQRKILENTIKRTG
jgi:hypothetical protein